MITRYSRTLSVAPWLALAGLVACAPADRAQEEGPRQVQQYTIQQLMKTTSYANASFSPDNSKLLVSHNGTGVFNAYAIPVQGGDPEPLTTSTTDRDALD